MPSQTSRDISIACLSWINERLREEVLKKSKAERDARKRRWTLSRLMSVFSALILGFIWLLQS